MTDKTADRLIDEARRESDRRMAFIAGYGAALADTEDEDVLKEMSLDMFAKHVNGLFREYEEGLDQ